MDIMLIWPGIVCLFIWYRIKDQKGPVVGYLGGLGVVLVLAGFLK